MEHPEQPVRPTVTPDTGLKIKVPSTPEGKEFLNRLKELLAVEELPFQKICGPGPATPDAGATHAEALRSAPSGGSGSTTYALDLRLEQEGWAP